MTQIKEYLNSIPQIISEESALISVYFDIINKNKNWFLNSINPPGGDWNELRLKKDNQIIKRSFDKRMKRLDLILQHNDFFLLSEAKSSFRKIINQSEKNYSTFNDQKKYIEDILKTNIIPIYTYICSIDNINLFLLKLLFE